MRVHRKSGFTLLEVLISAVVVSIGVLGVATLIPLAQYQIQAAKRADTAANIGRAALNSMIMQGWVDDIEGLLVAPLDDDDTGYNVHWYNGRNRKYTTQSDKLRKTSDFLGSDDFQLREDLMTDADPLPYYDTELLGNYEWVGSILPLEEDHYYEVSAAVCYKRPDTGLTVKVNGFNNIAGKIRITGTLSTTEEENRLSRGEYLYLTNGTYGHWYKILSIDNSNGASIELDGPTWTYSTPTDAFTPGHVIAVYTEIVSTSMK